MKEIWINLELYIKRYDFYKLGIFSGFLKLFFLFYFRFLIIKINKKIKKRGAGPAWMRRGTQGHVAAPRGPRTAYVARIYYIILLLLYIIKGFFNLAKMGRVLTLLNVGYYIPDIFLNIFRVGLILPISGDVVRGGSSDRRRASIA